MSNNPKIKNENEKISNEKRFALIEKNKICKPLKLE